MVVCGSYMSANSVPEDMADTSIRVTHDLADELFDRKRRGESYEDVIWRLIEQADKCDAENTND